MAEGTIFNVLGQTIMKKYKKEIYICMNHFAVQQKLTPHCKSIKLKLKKIFRKDIFPLMDKY